MGVGGCGVRQLRPRRRRLVGGAWSTTSGRLSSCSKICLMRNDVWNSVGHAGLKPLFVLAIAMLNSDHGPWSDARWLQEAREAATAYAAVGSVSDPLFQRLFHDIVGDMELGDRLDDPALPGDIFASIGESVRTMNEKVSTARWFGVFQTLDGFFSKWSRRYLLLTYLGKELGIWSGAPASAFAKQRPRSPPRTPPMTTRAPPRRPSRWTSRA